MERDVLIALLLAHVPQDGNVCVENCNIHDSHMRISREEGEPGRGPLTMGSPKNETYYLLQGTCGL